MAQRIKLRNGTAAQWAAANPVLGAGEPGFDLTNGIYKVGDGSTAWGDLSGLPLDPELLSEVIQSSVLAAAASQYAPFGAGAMRRLMSKMGRDALNASVIVIGDSTGNESTEWVYLMAEWLADRYPTYTVNYYLWGTTDYGSAVVVQTGSGSNTLSIYNASVGGATISHFVGSRFTNAVSAKDADLLFINSGHNDGGPINTANSQQAAQNLNLALVEEVLQRNPNAGVCLIAQNPSRVSGRESWMAQRAQVLERICLLRGFGLIDVHQAFLDYVSNGGTLADLYADTTHPNAEGQALWSSVVAKALARAAELEHATQVPSVLTVGSARQIITNPAFETWPSTNPSDWTVSNCSTSKETTNKETGTQAMRLTTSGSGAASASWSIAMSTLGYSAALLAYTSWTLAVRIYVPTSNAATVRIQLQDNNGSGQAASTDVAASSRDRYQWVFVTKTFASNATTPWVLIYPRTSGSDVVTIDVDRVLLIPGSLPLVA